MFRPALKNAPDDAPSTSAKTRQPRLEFGWLQHSSRRAAGRIVPAAVEIRIFGFMAVIDRDVCAVAAQSGWKSWAPSPIIRGIFTGARTANRAKPPTLRC